MTSDDQSFRNGLLGLIPQLRAYALSLTRCKDKADDLVQDTLTQAWAHRSGLRDMDRLKPWLLTILRNAHNMACRNRKLEPACETGAASDADGVPGAQEYVVELDEVNAALRTLPADEHEALMLIGVQGLSYEEAANVCGCPLGTMKSRLSRARQRLLAALSPSLVDVRAASERLSPSRHEPRRRSA